MRYQITYTDKSGAFVSVETTGASKAYDLQVELKQSGMEDVEIHLMEEVGK